MKYLLDTNTCIRYLNQRSQPIIRRFSAIPDSDIMICSVVKAELYLGAMKSQVPEKTMLKQRVFAERFYSYVFDDNCALIYAKIRAILEQSGMPIGSNDVMIASIAIANDLILVTHNIREFSRIKDLRIEDWE